MLTFKQYLLEKKMNTKTYSEVRARLSDSVKIGFEFEMLVPRDNYFYEKVHTNTKTAYVKNLSYSDIEDYFIVDGRDSRAIRDSYSEYIIDLVDEEFTDWKNDHEADDDFDEDKFDREDAYEKIVDHLDMDDWIKKEFKTVSDFIEHFDLEPRYGYTNNYRDKIYIEENENQEDDIELTADKVSDNLYKHVGKVKVFSKAHQTVKGNDWVIEPDGSITGSGHGLELVSPPMKLEEGMKILKFITTWMDDNEIETNSSTGLHINISIAHLDKLDPLKLVLFMGEKKMLTDFDRIGNQYTIPQISGIISNISNRGLLNITDKGARGLIDIARNCLSKDKYRTANLSKIEHGYIEFRVAGGHNYQKKFDTIETSIMKILTALDIACDPDADKDEYLKKVYGIFNKTKENIENKSLNLMTTHSVLPKELYRLTKYKYRIKENWEEYISATNKKVKDEQLLNLIYLCTTVGLEVKEKAYLRYLMKKEKLNLDEVRKEVETDTRLTDANKESRYKAIADIKKEFNL
jgi:hypothetical protein